MIRSLMKIITNYRKISIWFLFWWSHLRTYIVLVIHKQFLQYAKLCKVLPKIFEFEYFQKWIYHYILDCYNIFSFIIYNTQINIKFNWKLKKKIHFNSSVIHMIRKISHKIWMKFYINIVKWSVLCKLLKKYSSDANCIYICRIFTDA